MNDKRFTNFKAKCVWLRYRSQVYLLVWVTGQNWAVSDQNSSGDQPEIVKHCTRYFTCRNAAQNVWLHDRSSCPCWLLTWWAWLLSYGLARRSFPRPGNGYSWFAVLGCRSQPYTWDKRAAIRTGSRVPIHRWLTLSLSTVLKQQLIDFLSDNWSITDFYIDTTLK